MLWSLYLSITPVTPLPVIRAPISSFRPMLFPWVSLLVASLGSWRPQNPDFLLMVRRRSLTRPASNNLCWIGAVRAQVDANSVDNYVSPTLGYFCLPISAYLLPFLSLQCDVTWSLLVVLSIHRVSRRTFEVYIDMSNIVTLHETYIFFNFNNITQGNIIILRVFYIEIILFGWYIYI